VCRAILRLSYVYIFDIVSPVHVGLTILLISLIVVVVGVLVEYHIKCHYSFMITFECIHFMKFLHLRVK
jgi:hypothetical protein